MGGERQLRSAVYHSLRSKRPPPRASLGLLYWPYAMKTARCLSLVLALFVVCSARGASAQQPSGIGSATQPTFRVNVDLVTSDVIVRDRQGQFVPDLAKGDFEIFEDGVKQELTSLVLVHGGRAYTSLTAAPMLPSEGIILPAARPVKDTAGRIIIFIVDDMHLEFRDTSRIRALFNQMARELVHEGDLFGVVSTGTSSIAIDLTYDRKRLAEAANKITGGALRPSEIVQQNSGPDGSGEVRYRAHVAFTVANDLMAKLVEVRNRRKAVVIISNGYDFDPFGSVIRGNSTAMMDPSMRASGFSDADLASELHELTRAANRANATLYTIDPRGLIAGQDLDAPVDSMAYESNVQKAQDSLRVMAEQTGGLAVVNTNDFDKALKRIDAEISDYYVLGYYSTNPDPLQRRREIEIKVKKKGPEESDLALMYRREYVIKPAPTGAAEAR